MKVLVDANVLYPTVMRRLVLGAAEAGLFAPLWSRRIEAEWRHAMARDGAVAALEVDAEVARLVALFPRARVAGFEHREAALWLPDPADVHVLAAAIEGAADAILTQNAKDFPRDALADWGIDRADPDGFLLGLWQSASETMAPLVDAVVADARRVTGVDRTPRALLRKARLGRLGKAVEAAG